MDKNSSDPSIVSFYKEIYTDPQGYHHKSKSVYAKANNMGYSVTYICIKNYV